jgi:enoyl-CoA hydratase/carnithine racemase
MGQLVVSQTRDGVLEVTLTRPQKRNALSTQMFAELGEAFAGAADPAVTRVLVRGEGAVFCAGIDLDSLAALAGAGNGAADFESAGGELQSHFMALERAGKPSVAAIQGAAFGAGLQLALACDLRVAAEGTRMGFFEIRYGIIPDLSGIHRAVQLMGPARAKDLILTGREIQADEAMRLGLVDRVVPADKVETTARALLDEIGSRSPAATSAAKRLVDAAAAGQAPDANLRDVLRAQLELLHSLGFAQQAERLAEREAAKPPA